ncbi:aconitase family-domain-containing protein [Rhodocollybia butyracea]|uniref:3-isopropylmalate dehydratase n=1 Tax=Rhodocollybia butyracea TaxID=206335 RepID=A0A9P5PR86_9AGAR|nr:aconitase family-domain-containing protein [Rhodocollybia butyracea]
MSTLYDKIWQNHVVSEGQDASAPSLIFVDRHLVHEVSSPQAFESLWSAKRIVRRPDCTLATADHNVPTTPRAESVTTEHYVRDPISRAQVTALEKNMRRSKIPYYGLGDERQGIVHVIGGEQGFILPGAVCVCGDSHTSTLGAFGALAFGIGTSEVEHVLATQTLRVRKSLNMRVTVDGELGLGVTSKDVILHIIGTIGTAGGTGFVIEYAGSVVRGLSMEARMTMCNMSIEAGARAGLVAPDDVTVSYLRNRPLAPDGNHWDQGVEFWRSLKTDEHAKFDREVFIKAEDILPTVTWGTSPQDSVPISGSVPDPSSFKTPQRREAAEKSLKYMGLTPGTPMESIVVDKVFIGSCTNSRIEDLRNAAAILTTLGPEAKVSPNVAAMVVPGSGVVKRQAEAEGLDVLFRRAGFDWREAGCSMCIGLNPDQLGPEERCASTSNRNFEGRQGDKGRTHLVSPAMAVAAAVTGKLTDVRKIVGAAAFQKGSDGPQSLPPMLFGETAIQPDELSDEAPSSQEPLFRQIRQFVSVKGVGVPIHMENVDTDKLLPAKFLKTITRTGLGDSLFYRLRVDEVTGQKSDFILNREPFDKAKILVCTGSNFGCGSSREHAVWALKDFGISCVIAQSFGDIFFNNCNQNGLLLVTLPADVCVQLADYAATGAEIDIDLEKEQVTCMKSGLVVPFHTNGTTRRRLLRGTDDIEDTLAEADKISAYEKMRRERWSWLELDITRTRRRAAGGSLEW